MPLASPLRATIIICLSLLTIACQSGAVLTERSWQNHRNLIAESTQWTLQGRLNIRQQNSSDTVSINWQQQTSNFEINLSGALGLGATLIHGDPTLITLERANEAPITAASLTELSRDYLGYEFPAEVLYYWIRGIPAPDSPADIELNEQQLLATLSQMDSLGRRWNLQYDRYQNSAGLSLPGRIRMQHPDYQLTLIIQNWQLNGDA